MTVNLFGPYQSNPSQPRVQGVAFYSPSRNDFLFGDDGPPRIFCLPHQRALSLDWELSHNRLKTPMTRGAVNPLFDNSFEITIPARQLVPGFYDLHVTVHLSETQTLKGVTTFGWRYTETEIFPQKPKDFDAFWESALQNLGGIPPEPRWTFEKLLRGDELGEYNVTSASLPERYDPDGELHEEVEVYRICFDSYDHKTIEGWFTKPKGKGPFPALLVLPGAGNIPRPAPVEHARHGYAALDIQVHGNPVDALEYMREAEDNAENPEKKHHYAIYLHAMQAARAIKQLPGVDSESLALVGGSQGGRLALVVAALDPSVKAVIAAIAHFAYMPWLRWTDRQNETKQAGEGGFAGQVKVSDSLRVESYFDILNFASLVRCPVLINSGLTDRISPPTGIFSAYRALGGRKEMISLPNTGHDWSPAFDRYAWRWLKNNPSQTSS